MISSYHQAPGSQLLYLEDIVCASSSYAISLANTAAWRIFQKRSSWSYNTALHVWAFDMMFIIHP